MSFKAMGDFSRSLAEKRRRMAEEHARRKEAERVAAVTPVNQQFEQAVRLQSLFGRRNAIQANVRDRLNTEAAAPELNIRTSSGQSGDNEQSTRRRRATGPYTTGVNI